MPSTVFKISKLLCLSGWLFTTSIFAQINMDDDVGQLVFNNLPTAGVIEKIADLSGKIILNAQGVPQNALNFDSNGPMSRREAILALESLLELNGVSLIPLGEGFLKVVPSGSAQGQAPELIDTEYIINGADTQKTYAHIFELDYITRQEAINIATNFLTPSGNINELPNINGFYMQDSLSALKRVQIITDRIDSPLKIAGRIHFIQTANISAEIAVRQLTEMRQGPLKNLIGESTTFTANERGNQVIVVTNEANMGLIRGLVAELDVEVKPITQSRLFNINQASATDVSALLNSLISEQNSRRDDTEAAQVTNQGGQNNRNNENSGGNDLPTPTNSAATDPGSNKIREGFSDFISILPDERSNSIVAFGTASDLLIIEKLINDLDVKLDLVKIDVIITEVTLSDEQARGVDSFNVSLNPLGVLNTDGEYDYGITSTSSSGLAQPLDIQGSIRDFSLQMIFDTAQQKSNVRVLQAPTITVTHNEEGEIKIGERRPIITSSSSDLTNVNNVRSQVSFEDIGITLLVEPLIGKNGNIQLKVEQEISSVIGFVDIDGNQQPVIGSRTARSTLSVQDQEVIILGGLQENNESKGRTRMAIIGRIPLLGSLLGGKTVESSRREIIIFLKPTILQGATRSEHLQRTVEGSSLADPLKNYFEKQSFGDVESIEAPE